MMMMAVLGVIVMIALVVVTMMAMIMVEWLWLTISKSRICKIHPVFISCIVDGEMNE